MKKILATIGRTLGSCAAVVALLAILYYGSSFICTVLTALKDMIYKLWVYVSGNWTAVLVIIGLIIVGNILYTVIAGAWARRGKKAKKNAGE